MYKALPVFAFLAVVLFSACEKQPEEFYSGTGLRPVYLPLDQLRDIRNEPPRPITQSGTIFLRDTLLFIVEQRQGIHVFSLADTANTVNLAFFKIPAITDFTISGNTLYADSWRDLVVIDISDLQQIKETARVADVLQPALYPPLYRGIFECVDETRGAVVGWEEVALNDARCMTTN